MITGRNIFVTVFGFDFYFRVIFHCTKVMKVSTPGTFIGEFAMDGINP